VTNKISAIDALMLMKRRLVPLVDERHQKCPTEHN